MIQTVIDMNPFVSVFVQLLYISLQIHMQDQEKPDSTKAKCDVINSLHGLTDAHRAQQETRTARKG